MIAIGTDTGGQQDFRAYLRIFWRWKLLFLFVVVAIPVAVYLLERGKPRIYQSSTLIELQDVTVQLGTTSAPVQTGNIDAVARLVTTTPLSRIAARLMRPPNPAGFYATSVSASADTNTGFITITAQAPDANLAAQVATAYSRALGVHQAADASSSLYQQVKGQQALLRVTVGATARAAILAQIAQLRGLLGSVGSGAQVIQPAEPNFTSISPHIRRTVEVSLVVAILLAIGVVLLAESGDRRLRSPDDLEKLTGYPLLAVIPSSAFAADREESPAEEEAFQMLRAAMTYFNVESPPASVAVISPLVEDGKTTVAVGLAAASARSGRRVVLVDADLRRPQAEARLSMDESQAGLADVLSGNAQLDDVLIEHVIDGPEGGALTVLPSGRLPVNPSGLLSSRDLDKILWALEERSDLVVVDTAAALAVSDSLPLMQAVSGVIVVVRMNRSSRAAVRRIKNVISAAQATVLGVVATGSAAAAAGYGDYYGKRGRRWRRFRRGRSNYYARVATTNGAAPARNGTSPATKGDADAQELESVKDA